MADLVVEIGLPTSAATTIIVHFQEQARRVWLAEREAEVQLAEPGPERVLSELVANPEERIRKEEERLRKEEE